MAQLNVNPWLIGTSDVANSQTISSIVGNGASALVTLSGAITGGLANGQNISIQGVTGSGSIFNGGYKIAQVTSTTSFYITLAVPSTVSSGASGSVYTALYPFMVRIEQVLWDGGTSGDTVLLTDAQGNTVWNPTLGVNDGPYTYGKLFWVGRGLVVNSLPHGNLQLTVN